MLQETGPSPKYTVIVPVGKDLTPIYVGVREFPTQEVYLLHRRERLAEAEAAKAELAKFKIDGKLVELSGDPLESMFRSFASIRSSSDEGRLLVNVSSGEKMGTCASLAAAFVNGLKAFHVEGERIVMLPVMKFSYYKLLSKRKLEIIRYLRDQPECCTSLEDLSRRTKMSLPLISYHINNKKEGLLAAGLVVSEQVAHGRIKIHLSELGRLIADGCAEN